MWYTRCGGGCHALRLPAQLTHNDATTKDIYNLKVRITAPNIISLAQLTHNAATTKDIYNVKVRGGTVDDDVMNNILIAAFSILAKL